jgi:hypothetical protein
MVAQPAIPDFQPRNQKFFVVALATCKPHAVINELIGIIAFAGCKNGNVSMIMLDFYLEIRIVTMNIRIKTKLDFDVPNSH